MLSIALVSHFLLLLLVNFGGQIVITLGLSVVLDHGHGQVVLAFITLFDAIVIEVIVSHHFIASEVLILFEILLTARLLAFHQKEL